MYVYNLSNINTINIKDTLIDEKGNDFMNLLRDKCLEFMIKIPTSSVHFDDEHNTSNFKITYNGKACKWGFRNELLYMTYKAIQENAEYLWVKCFAEYIDNNFVVKCTNALNLLENEIIISGSDVITEIDEVYNGKEIPTEEAVVKYVHLHTDDSDIHVSTIDKTAWNNTVVNSINDISSSDSYLIKGEKYNNVLELGINATQNISNDNTTIPTTKAVYDYVENVQKTFNEEIDRIDDVLGGISGDLNSEESDKGIKIIQENGVITSLTVTPASVENGELVDTTKDNVITGSAVKALLDNRIQEISQAGLNYKIADDLPTASSSEKGWIYLIPKTSKITNNEYVEFICVDKDDNGTWAWEQIGTTKADLTEYATKEYVNLHTNDSDIHTSSVERNNWNNHINNEDIHITSDERTSCNNNITNTNNHIADDTIHVTSTDKSTWDSKIDNVIGNVFIDSYRNDNNITLSLNTTEEIIDSDVHVPTSKAVYDSLVARTPWEKDIKEFVRTGQIETKSTDISGGNG